MLSAGLSAAQVAQVARMECKEISRVAKALRQANRPDDAIRLLLAATDVWPRNEYFWCQLISASHAHKELAWYAVYCIERLAAPLSIWTYNSVIHLYLKQGDIPRAQQTLSSMAAAKVSPNVVTYTLFIDAHSKAGNMSSAWHLLLSMKAAGIEPNAFVYDVLIQASCRLNPADGANDARTAYLLMRRDGIKPDLSTYTSVMAAFARAERLGDMWRAYRDLLTANVAPDHKALQLLLDACFRSGDPGQVSDALYAHERAGFAPQLSSFLRLMKMYGAEQNVKEIKRTLRRILAAGFVLSPAIYSVVAEVFSAAQLYGEGAALLQQFVLPPHNEIEVAELLRQAGSFAPAKAICRDIMLLSPHGSAVYQQAYLCLLHLYLQTDSQAFAALEQAPPFDGSSPCYVRFVCLQIQAQSPLVDVARAYRSLRAAFLASDQAQEKREIGQALSQLNDRSRAICKKRNEETYNAHQPHYSFTL